MSLQTEEEKAFPQHQKNYDVLYDSAQINKGEGEHLTTHPLLLESSDISITQGNDQQLNSEVTTQLFPQSQGIHSNNPSISSFSSTIESGSNLAGQEDHDE
jgi:hypothetical protein